MSELAFDKEGNPFRFSRRTHKLRPRRWKNAGQRGTCAAVLDADGEQVLLAANAEYIEFRTAVGNVPGFYRLDQCDEDGTPLEDAPPAYVSIESTRNTMPIGDVDPRDAIIRDLAQINADMVRTITERFGNVMQATADILRAADGAGVSRRPPATPPATPVPDDDDDDHDDDEENENDEDRRPPPSERVWAMVEPMLPTIGAWIAEMATKRFASRSPAAPPPAPAAEPFPAVPSSAVAPGGAVGANAPEPVVTAEPAVAPPPATVSTSGVTAASADSSTAPALVGPVSSTPSPVPAPVAELSSAMPPPAATSEGATLDAVTPSSTAITDPMPADAAQADAPRNALQGIEPTPQQWAHLFAIRARLSPREAAITETVAVRMPLEMRAQWLAELSLLSVDEAVEVVRSMIPKPAPKSPAIKGSGTDRGKDREG